MKAEINSPDKPTERAPVPKSVMKKNFHQRQMALRKRSRSMVLPKVQLKKDDGTGTTMRKSIDVETYKGRKYDLYYQNLSSLNKAQKSLAEKMHVAERNQKLQSWQFLQKANIRGDKTNKEAIAGARDLHSLNSKTSGNGSSRLHLKTKERMDCISKSAGSDNQKRIMFPRESNDKLGIGSGVSNRLKSSIEIERSSMASPASFQLVAGKKDSMTSFVGSNKIGMSEHLQHSNLPQKISHFGQQSQKNLNKTSRIKRSKSNYDGSSISKPSPFFKDESDEPDPLGVGRQSEEFTLQMSAKQGHLEEVEINRMASFNIGSTSSMVPHAKPKRDRSSSKQHTSSNSPLNNCNQFSDEVQKQVTEMINYRQIAENVCICQYLKQHCWRIQRFKLALGYFKDDNKQLRKTVENTKMFMNLVIHDLRNPTSQINFSIQYAMESLELINLMRIEYSTLFKQQMDQMREQFALTLDKFEKNLAVLKANYRHTDKQKYYLMDQMNMLKKEKEELIKQVKALKAKVKKLSFKLRTEPLILKKPVGKPRIELDEVSTGKNQILLRSNPLNSLQVSAEESPRARRLDSRPLEVRCLEDTKTLMSQLKHLSSSERITITDFIGLLEEKMNNKESPTRMTFETQEMANAGIGNSQESLHLGAPSKLSSNFDLLKDNRSKFIRAKQQSQLTSMFKTSFSFEKQLQLKMAASGQSTLADEIVLQRHNAKKKTKKIVEKMKHAEQPPLVMEHNIFELEIAPVPSPQRLSDAKIGRRSVRNSVPMPVRLSLPKIQEANQIRESGEDLSDSLVQSNYEESSDLDDISPKYEVTVARSFHERAEQLLMISGDETSSVLFKQFETLREEWDDIMTLSDIRNIEIDKMTEEAYDMIESCRHSSIMLLNLINDLLDLAKQEKQTFQFNQKYFNLEAAIHQAFNTLEFLSSKKNIKMKLTFGEGHRKYFQSIYGDENRFEQILINFISNALKFSNQDGEVRVHLEASILETSQDEKKSQESLRQNQFQMKIIDNGQGISEEGQKHLFMDFSSLKEHRNANTRGTGLGLSICKKIIQKMGGKVSVQSKVGEGTTFSIELQCLCKMAKTLSASSLESFELNGLMSRRSKLRNTPTLQGSLRSNNSSLGRNHSAGDNSASKAINFQSDIMLERQSSCHTQTLKEKINSRTGATRSMKAYPYFQKFSKTPPPQERPVPQIAQIDGEALKSSRLSSRIVDSARSVSNQSYRSMDKSLPLAQMKSTFFRTSNMKLLTQSQAKRKSKTPKYFGSKDGDKSLLYSFDDDNSGSNKKEEEKVESGSNEKMQLLYRISSPQQNPKTPKIAKSTFQLSRLLTFGQALDKRRKSNFERVLHQTPKPHQSISDLARKLRHKDSYSSIFKRDHNDLDGTPKSIQFLPSRSLLPPVQPADTHSSPSVALTNAQNREKTWKEQQALLKVLVANDDMTLIYILEKMLKNQFGIIQVDTAHDGQQALTKARTFKYDVILMDLTMPVMNGFESSKKIKEYYNAMLLDNKESGLTYSPYIVALSASSFDQPLVTQCKDAMFDDWFQSPLSADDIQKKVLDKVLLKQSLMEINIASVKVTSQNCSQKGSQQCSA